MTNAASTGKGKAFIINLDTNAKVTCMFNPKELSVSKQNSWKEAKDGKNVARMEYTGGQPASLQLQLFFDTVEARADVRTKYTEQVWQLMQIDESKTDKVNKKGRPPYVRFQWGSQGFFDAVITSIRQQFTLFAEDGTPLRATLDVTFQQIKDVKETRKQNPTSGGVGGERVYRVLDGDTLALIAYREYGDSTRWRAIANANGLTKVRRLTPGAMLVIPND